MFEKRLESKPASAPSNGLKISYAAVCLLTSVCISMFLIYFIVGAFTAWPAESDLDERRTCFSFSG